MKGIYNAVIFISTYPLITLLKGLLRNSRDLHPTSRYRTPTSIYTVNHKFVEFVILVLGELRVTTPMYNKRACSKWTPLSAFGCILFLPLVSPSWKFVKPTQWKMLLGPPIGTILMLFLAQCLLVPVFSVSVSCGGFIIYWSSTIFF
jgi:hypothetical protein